MNIKNEGFDGLVIRAQTGIYYVQYDGQVAECILRKKVKREFQSVVGDKRRNIYSDPVAVGDKVIITLSEGNKGAIEDIMPRKSKLSRVAPGSYIKLKSKQTKVPKRLKFQGTALGATPIEEIVVANADQLLITMSTRLPSFNSHLLDRFIIVSEAGGLEPVICVNKIDLLNHKEREEFIKETRVYEDIGYRLFYTSALEKEGLDKLVEVLRDKLTALAGPSGAGKSTLLNVIQPNLNLRMGEVSEKTQKGKHTTTNVELHSLDFGGYVVDTPGIRELGLWDIWKDDMPHFFPEMRPYLTACRFNNCSHVDEPECAIKKAVAEGKIAQMRYNSYLKLRSIAPTGGYSTDET